MIVSIRFNYAGFLLQLGYENEHALKILSGAYTLQSLQFYTDNCSTYKTL